MRSLRGQRRPLCQLICASFSLNSIYELYKQSFVWGA